MRGAFVRPRMEIKMDQMRFKTGDFQVFVATRSFALGNFNVQIESGTEIEFDGSTVKYAGADYAFPQLRGALSVGWIVLAEAYQPDDPEYRRPPVAQIQVRSATQGDQPRSMIATVEQDEHIVMSSRDHATQTKAANRRSASEAGSDGVPVRNLKTPAVSATDINSAQAVLSALDDVRITPGQGITVAEKLARMSDAEREQYLLKKEAARASYVQDVAAKSGSGKAVGRVKSAAASKSTEGMKLTSSTGGGIETWDSGEAPVVASLGGVSAAAATVVEDGITFSTTNVPEAKRASRKQAAKTNAAPMSVAVRLRVAKALCPDFPESYDFSAPLKKRLARLQADFEDRVDVLRAVFAAEDELVKTQILELFPQAFA